MEDAKEEGEEAPANKKPLSSNDFQENTVDARSKVVKANRKARK